MSAEQPITDYDHPVAYDAEGRPLYAHPPNDQPQQPQVVHVARPTEPEKPTISDSIKIKHNKSKQLYPELNLSDGEYIISAIGRHPIGMIVPFIAGIILISIAFTMIFNFDIISKSLSSNNTTITAQMIIIPAILVILIAVICTYIAYYIYSNNRFFLTNESVIQEIQKGLFRKREQTVGLANIEDASFIQRGIVQQLFNYGSIRLSTRGDETSYRFSFVANPKEQIAILNNAVEDFQNGRPVNQ